MIVTNIRPIQLTIETVVRTPPILLPILIIVPNQIILIHTQVTDDLTCLDRLQTDLPTRSLLTLRVILIRIVVDLGFVVGVSDYLSSVSGSFCQFL